MIAEPTLYIDVSTPICAVCLVHGDELFHRFANGRGIHSEVLFTQTEEVLKEAQLTMDNLSAIVLTGGPGSYTGLRIGASAVKGFAFGKKIDVWLMSTLPVFSASIDEDSLNAEDPVPIHCIMNARRKHLFHQLVLKYPDGHISVESEAAVRAITDLEPDLKKGAYIAGTGCDRLSAEVEERCTVVPVESVNTAVWMHAIIRKESAKNAILKQSALLEKVEPDSFEPYYYSPGHA